MAAHQAPPPRDSPCKNTGVSCHFLLHCRNVKSESEDAQSCPTLSDPMDCSPPGSSLHGIFQARVLEWGAIALHKNTRWEKDLFSTILCESLIEPSINTGGPEKSFIHWSTKYFLSTSYHEQPFCWKQLNCFISVFILKNIYKQQINK